MIEDISTIRKLKTAVTECMLTTFEILCPTDFHSNSLIQICKLIPFYNGGNSPREHGKPF